MINDKELQEDFKALVEKTIKANMSILNDIKDHHYQERAMIVSNVTHNLELISKAINI